MFSEYSLSNEKHLYTESATYTNIFIYHYTTYSALLCKPFFYTNLLHLVIVLLITLVSVTQP